MPALLWALAGTGFTFFATALGAAVVFLFKKEIPSGLQRAFLGFAAGIMIAASVFSLLLPSIEMAGEQGLIVWLPAAVGFLLGGVFLVAADKLMPIIVKTKGDAAVKNKSSFMLVLAITLHNIPEGMAVGLAFAMAAQGGSAFTYASAATLAVGIGLQNMPEGAAISLPLRQEGAPPWKAFLAGAFSGVVEPLAAMATVLFAPSARVAMPWLLAFAAGCMVYVVLEELVPGAHLEDGPGLGTAGAMLAFVLMMVLDVALG